MPHSLVIIIAKYFIIFPVVIAFWVWLKLDRKHKREFILLGLLATICTGVLAVIGSHLYHDPRPFVVGHFTPYFPHGNDNGFPSDHTLLGSLLAFVTLRYDRRLGGISLAIAALVGLARVIAGVHHLVDIAGAMLIAGLSVYAAGYGLSWWSKRHSAAKPPVAAAD